jgi:lipopolysaccharide exporter
VIDEPDAHLAGTAVGGVLWQGASYLLGKVLVLVSTIVLARILAPAQVGLVGLALVFIAYVEVITDLGVAQALIFLPPDRRRNDAALTLALAMSAVLVLAAMFASGAIGRFFGTPQVTALFRVMSLSLLIGAVGQIPDALLRRELRFRKRVVADLSRAATQGGVSVALALAGLGPWAIAYGYLAGGLVWAGVSWSLVSYRPRWGFWRLGRAVSRPLAAYGLPAAGNALLLSLVFDIDYLIVGRRLGAGALGLYTLGFRIPEMLIINVFYVLSAVAFPLYSRARRDPVRLRRGYLTGLRLQSAYGMSAGAGLAMVAPMLVRVLFGPRWTGAVVPLEGLALYAAFRSLGMGAVDVFKALGRPGLAVAMAFVRLAVLAPALVVATRWGIGGVAITQAVVALVLALVMQGVAARALDVPIRTVGRVLLPSLTLAAGAAGGVVLVRMAVGGPDALRLILALVAGTAGALAVSRATDRSFLAELRVLLRARKLPAKELVA